MFHINRLHIRRVNTIHWELKLDVLSWHMDFLLGILCDEDLNTLTLADRLWHTEFLSKQKARVEQIIVEGFYLCFIDVYL